VRAVSDVDGRGEKSSVVRRHFRRAGVDRIIACGGLVVIVVVVDLLPLPVQYYHYNSYALFRVYVARHV